MSKLTSAQLSFAVQFLHPEKTNGHFPAAASAVNDASSAALFGVSVARYRKVKRQFAQDARNAAKELLADRDFRGRVERLPFKPGQTVVGLGDSITDDYQSWLEILRYLVPAKKRVRFINAGVSGDTTSQMITRFLAVVLEKPDWVICFAGTNDARKHGRNPTKTLVSLAETVKNLKALRHYAATQTRARWVWITPATVIQKKVARHWMLGPMQLSWSNKDQRAIAKALHKLRDPVVDLQPVFGDPPNPKLLLADGLHPSLAGQEAIVRALVERLTS